MKGFINSIIDAISNDIVMPAGQRGSVGQGGANSSSPSMVGVYFCIIAKTSVLSENDV